MEGLIKLPGVLKKGPGPCETPKAFDSPHPRPAFEAADPSHPTAPVHDEFAAFGAGPPVNAGRPLDPSVVTPGAKLPDASSHQP